MSGLSQKTIEAVKKEMQRYESKLSAVLPALYIVQHEQNWVSPEAMHELSSIMDIPVAHINEVATFYTMYNKEPVGKYHIQVCTNITCSMKGGREMTNYICKKLNVKTGEMTADKKFTVSKVECLGSCDTAPVLQVNYDYHESLTEEKIDKLLEGLK